MSDIMYPQGEVIRILKDRERWRTIAIKISFNQPLTEEEEKTLQTAMFGNQ